MRNMFRGAVVLTLTGAFALADQHQSGVVHPSKISKPDTAGQIFDREDMLKTNHDDGHTTLDVTTLLSSDGKFASGMYKSGKTRSEINEPYGVDEFMFFLEGGVTLTSSDGTVMEIGAGEGVTIPKEWTGIWVIYSEDGSGL